MNDIDQLLNTAGTSWGQQPSQQASTKTAPLIGAKEGKIKSFQDLAMSRIGLGGKRRQMMSNLQMQELQNQINASQPGILDYLGLGFSGLGTLKAFNQRNKIKALQASNGGLWNNGNLMAPTPNYQNATSFDVGDINNPMPIQ
jgi:hypothetical protein